MRVSGRSVLLLFRRVLVVWAVEVAGLWLLSRLMPGMTLRGIATAVWAVAALALLNAVLRPVLLLLTFPLTVLSFGLLTLGLNALMVALAGRLIDGFEVVDFASALAAALGLSAINTIAASLLSLNEEDSVYRNIVKRLAGRTRPAGDCASPGLVIIEIDGLSSRVLRRAISEGHVPHLARWVRSGRHRLISWDCGLPSQSSSSQAGILCGNNFDIPAFRWYEKDSGRMLVSNNPFDAAEIERRVSSGEGLLRGGYSLGNLISGDAERSLLTMSTLMDPARSVVESSGQFFLFLLNPYHFSRAFLLALWEIAVEYWQAIRQRALNVRPRVPRGGRFPIARAIATVLLREVNAYVLMAEMFGGARVSYTTFVGYDVIAHHAGPERPEAMRALRDLDRRIALLERAARDARRPYGFVVLSDHGQSYGATFKQRHGITFEGLVRSLLSGDRTVRAYGGRDETWGHLNALLSEAVRHQSLAGRTARRILRRRTRSGYVEVDPHPTTAPAETPNVVVCASGNLGLVYFTDDTRRLALEQIAAAYPGLIEGLVRHPGIGFIMVDSNQHGPLALGARGIHHLKSGKVDGEDPLAPFGGRAAEHLRRIDAFPHVGDLLVNSSYDPATCQVAAFEELVGSHGGLGGAQTDAFFMYPADWDTTPAAVRDPVDIYWLLRRRLEDRRTTAEG